MFLEQQTPCSHWDLSPVSCTGETEPWQGGRKIKQGSNKSEGVAEKKGTLDSSAQMVLQHIRFPLRGLLPTPAPGTAFGRGRVSRVPEEEHGEHLVASWPGPGIAREISFVKLKESAAFQGGNRPYSEFCQIVFCLCLCSSACLCGHAAVSPCRQDSFCLCLSLAALSPLSFGLGVSVQQRGSDRAGR